ncbi:MAG TPA: ATP-binding protein [Chitinophagaceae bacterium]|nr:ATP-binding protein [Chitinophagaceae bacterium]
MIEGATERMAMLAAIIDSSEDAIISKNLNGIIISWNKAAELMFGHSEKEAIGKHISLIIPKDRLQEEEMIIASLRRGERIEHYHTIRVTKTGKELNISLSISPIRNEHGEVTGASKIARDITRQKEAENTIAQYVQILEMINDAGKTLASELDINAILQKTTDATTTLCGAAFGAFFYNKTDSKGESYLLYALSGAPREAFEKFGMPGNTDVFKITFSGQGVLRSDDITKDHRYGKNSPHKGMPEVDLPVVSYMAVPVVSQNGVVIGGLFFGHPRPAMFKEEHEIFVEAIATQAGIALNNAKLYQELRKLSAKKDEFIGFTSHELKTPLTTISGYLQLIEQAPELAQQVLPKVTRQVSRLSAIISDLLDISKIHAGKFELNLSKASLLSLIKDSVESVKLLAADYKIECKLPKDDILLTIDATKMQQVLVNILSNAIKYSPGNKKIVVTAEYFGDDVKISIRDWGIGISAEHLDEIFTQFYRITKDESKIQGLGLGLYLCKEFVEAHHGKIWAGSKVGKGTIVYVVLPIKHTQE